LKRESDAEQAVAQPIPWHVMLARPFAIPAKQRSGVYYRCVDQRQLVLPCGGA
jgi:hypothetical protein